MNRRISATPSLRRFADAGEFFRDLIGCAPGDLFGDLDGVDRVGEDLGRTVVDFAGQAASFVFARRVHRLLEANVGGLLNRMEGVVLRELVLTELDHLDDARQVAAEGDRAGDFGGEVLRPGAHRVDVEERTGAAIDARLAVVDGRFEREFFEEALEFGLFLRGDGGDLAGALQKLADPRLRRRQLSPRFVEKRAEFVDRWIVVARGSTILQAPDTTSIRTHQHREWCTVLLAKRSAGERSKRWVSRVTRMY